MQKLSAEFARVADVVRFGNADEPAIGYAVLVGDPDLEFTFLEKEKFLHEDFTTRRDAQNAFNLARRTLEIIDEQFTDEGHAPILANLRRELIKAADKAVERAISKGVSDFDDVSLYAVISAEVVCELNNTFLNFFNRH